MRRISLSWRRSLGAIVLGWTCVFLCGPSLSAQPAKTGDLAIVVHPSTPVDGLTFPELRQVFLGDRQYWTASMPVVLLMRAPVAVEREAVLKVIYEMSEAQFKQYWIAKIFRAQSTSPPKIVYSNDTANQLVGSIPGAIAFVVASDVRPGVKALKIDGRLPGEPGYRLHLARP
jgi:ABC-type phosphate transport system substrate-binding protein